VVNTIRRENVNIPTGRVESIEREFLVKTRGRFATPEPMNDLIIAQRDGVPIRIRDVGRAVDGVENDRQLGRFLQQPAVGLGVVKQRDANTVALADSVEKRMARLAEDFPPGLEYRVAADDSTFIEQNIKDLVMTIFITTGLVVLVVLLFLRTLRGTLVAAFSIPASLLGGLAVISVLGFSINVLTLLALILAIGIVIDDSIVVLESSYRHMEQGDEAVNAARIGTSEVAFPSIANTLSLAAVFIPVAFTAGLIGRFFTEFSLTVAVTVAMSTFTALTLTPMLSSRLLKLPQKRGRARRAAQAMENGAEAGFARILGGAFGHRILTVVVGLIVLFCAVFFFTRLTKEFLPPIDRSEFMIRFETPEGSTIRYTDEYAKKLEDALADTPEVKHFFLAIGLSRGAGPGRVNQGLSFVRLLPRDQRDRHQSVVMQELRQRFAQIPGGQAYVLSPSFGPATGAALQVAVQRSDLFDLAREQEQIMGWMRSQPEYVGVNSDLKMNKPEIDVTIDRDKASQMGISFTEISNTLRFLLGEVEISEIERENERFEVIAESEKQFMVTSDLRHLYVRRAGGEVVALGNLVELEEKVGPSEIHHFNRLRAATLSSSTPPGVALGTALSKLEMHLQETLPRGFDYVVTGQAQDFQESFFYLMIALIFSVIFIYLVLAAQFESFIHPFTILVALPLAGVGAFGMLWALDMSFNIYSFIGVIMLTGMATKNAILMIDYTNILVARGNKPFQAAQKAAKVRFRPVIMTTMSTVLGMMPIALGFGAGGEARAPLGVAVAAGLLATTLLTLVVIPVVYTFMEALQRRIFGQKAMG
jgi:hydrophobe/amphiphile efflux-1 (HAE1) family protein